jgi:hypothetical protein
MGMPSLKVPRAILWLRSSSVPISWSLRSGLTQHLWTPMLDKMLAPSLKRCQKRGRHRWVVEHTLARIEQMGRLATRYERRADIQEVLTLLCCSTNFFKLLRRAFYNKL